MHSRLGQFVEDDAERVFMDEDLTGDFGIQVYSLEDMPSRKNAEAKWVSHSV